MNITINGQNASINVSSPEEAMKLLSMFGVKNIGVNVSEVTTKAKASQAATEAPKPRRTRVVNASNAYTVEELKLMLSNLDKGPTYISKMPELAARHSRISLWSYANLMTRNSSTLPKKVKELIADQLVHPTHSVVGYQGAAGGNGHQGNGAQVVRGPMGSYESRSPRITEDRP